MNQIINIFKKVVSLKISTFLEHFGYVKVLNKERTLKNLTDNDVLQALIFNALMVGIDLKSPTKAEHLQDIARGVVFSFNKLKALSLKEFLKSVEKPIFLDRQITFAIGAGIASYWEVQVKLLAQQIGIDVYEKSTRKNAKSPSLKDLEPIIEELKKAFPKIDFEFGRLIKLRNAVVHGNFHQIRTSASESRNNETKKAFKGKVMMVNLGNPSDFIFMSEEEELENIKNAGLFGWFLETGNSRLFETVIQEFQQSCFQINAIAHLKSLSFQETADVFKTICVDGIRLTKDERNSFINARKIFDSPPGLIEEQLKIVEKSLRK